MACGRHQQGTRLLPEIMWGQSPPRQLFLFPVNDRSGASGGEKPPRPGYRVMSPRVSVSAIYMDGLAGT